MRLSGEEETLTSICVKLQKQVHTGLTEKASGSILYPTGTISGPTIYFLPHVKTKAEFPVALALLLRLT